MLNLMTETAAAGGGMMLMIIYIVVIGAAMYFFAIRPQKKEQKKMQAMLAALEVGDTIVTTSGFYGVVIDITDEDCIVIRFVQKGHCLRTVSFFYVIYKIL